MQIKRKRQSGGRHWRHKRTSFNRQFEDDNIQASEIDPGLVISYRGFYNKKAKRLLDFILSVFMILCVSPILLIVSIAIIVEDGFPVFYRAERGGYHGHTFKICKFRSMIKHADRIGGGTTALNDQRITKVGKVIRKMKIDEIPNLFNVVCGEMSFIGPRPELLCYTERYTGTEKKILEVRPGMTDYSSIEFINLDEIVGSENADAMYEQYVLPRKNKLRVKYAATVSFRTDVKLFLLTVYKVIRKSGTAIIKK